MSLRMLCAAALFACAAPASADDVQIDDTIKVLSGHWEFSKAEGGMICRLTFSTEAAIHAFAVEKGEGCEKDFPVLVEVAGWTVLPEDRLRLTDALGKSVLDFEVVESGLYADTANGASTYFLSNADEGDYADMASVDKVQGDWLLAELGETPRCDLTLTGDADGEARYAVRIGEECTAPFKGNVAFWILDNGQLVLLKPDGQEFQRFDPADAVTWHVPGHEEIVLVRP